MNKLSAGNFENSFYKKSVNQIWDEFSDKNIEITFESLGTQPSFKIISEALINDRITFGVFPLSLIPIEKPEGIVITALSGRKKVNEVLLLKKESVRQGKLLNLEEGASVSFFSKSQKAQLNYFRSDLIYQKLDWSYFFKNEKLEFQTDAIILPEEYEELFEHEYLKIPIQPTELIPSPGQGVLAFVTLEKNFPSRRILKSFHHKEVSACTNIERNIQKELTDTVAAYCLKTPKADFHIHAARLLNQKLIRYNLASVTSIGLAKKTIEELSK